MGGPDRGHIDAVLNTCLHCGLCLPSCPTYEMTLDEASSPRGRIRLVRSVLDGSLAPGRAFADEMNFCLDCRACEPACPAGVRYGEIVETARGIVRDLKLEPFSLRFRKFVLLRIIFGSAAGFGLFARLMRGYRRSGLREAVERSGVLNLFPDAVRRTFLTLPDVADRSYLSTVPDLLRGRGAPAGRTGLFTGCVMNETFPAVHSGTADLLRRSGYDVVVPRGQFCCGSLHGHNGDGTRARELAAETIRLFPDGLDAVVVNAAGCGSFMKGYGRLFADDPAMADRAARFSAKVADVSEFFHDRGIGAPDGSMAESVTYHEACHLVHAQGVSKQPRALIRSIPGVRFVELPDASRCCGSAGIYNLIRPDDADELLRRKIASILQCGAGTVVTGNPGCHLQIQRGLREAGSAVEVVHPVTLLQRALTPARASLPSGA